MNLTLRSLLKPKTPLPDSVSEKVTEPVSGRGKNFGFGDIVFEDEGTYVYKVTEEEEIYRA